MSRTKSDIMSGVKPEWVVSSKFIEDNTVEYTTIDGSTVIRLHDTDIIEKKANGHVVLRCKGWNTNTTRDRFHLLGRFVPENYRVHVYSIKGQMRVSVEKKNGTYTDEWGTWDKWDTIQDVPFQEKMELYRGKILNKWVTKKPNH